MKFFKIILFMALVMPLMLLFSGCFNDAIFDAIKAEEDYIAPFDVVLSNEQTKRTSYFPVTATGSDKVVLTGDDASRKNLHRPIDLEVEDNYQVDGHHVVIDNVTGLMWTKCTAIASKTMDPNSDCSGSKIDDPLSLSNAPQLMDWFTARTTCKELEYAGHKDWRLPRLPELLTIANYGHYPAIDSSIFPNNKGGDVEVLHYTKRYSLDDRPRYMSNINNESINPPILPEDPDYTKVKYIKEANRYVFNEGYEDRYSENDNGTHVLAYLVYKDVTKYQGYVKYDDNEQVPISGETISFTSSDRYNYDPVWGFGYLQKDEGEYLRIFIPIGDEDIFSRDGIDYKSGEGPYVREYVPDIRVSSWEWSDFWGDYIELKDKYENSRTKYWFNGTKFEEKADGEFIQKFDKPFGYWTYSSKILLDENMNMSEYGWVVFFQNGGSFGVNISSPIIKVKEDSTFEKQFVRCVRGGKGDADDVDY